MNGSLSHLKSALQEVALPENLQSPFNQLLELLDAVLEENKQLLQRVKLLEEQLAVYRQEKFGRQSEKSSVLKSSTTQGEEKADSGGSSSVPQTSVSVSGYTRKPRIKGHTVELSRLLHTDILHDLSPEEKVCRHCQHELRQMGSEVAEQLERLPEVLYVARHIRMKYVCRRCHQIKMAPKLPSPIPKCLAGASLLADVIVRKFQYHLPLYRQSKILASQGIDISDSTLGHWVKQSGEVLLPLIEALWQRVRSAHYLQCDESPVQVVTAQKKGYLWVYLAPGVGDQKGLVSFQFALTRESRVVENHLARFSGLLQTDGYAGYAKLCAEKRIIDFGCWAHVRRKFVKVVEVSHSEGGKATEMLALIGELYAVEKVARNLKLSPRDRKRLRKKRQVSVLLKKINRWLRMVEPDVPPKSGLGKAIHYALNQWPRLIRYVRHGEVEIDNNLVENQIRGPTVGKSNWMFVQREENGQTNAGYYSLIHSCILNGINPGIYMHYVLTQAHAMRKKTLDPNRLLPHCIDIKLLEQFSQQQQMIMQEILNTS